MNITWSFIAEFSGWGVMLLGAFFLLSSGVGLLRMPDFFTRLHPAGMADAMGAPLMLLGIGLLITPGLLSIKIFLLVIFSMLTSATACHALARAALLSGKNPVGKIKRKKS